MDHDVDPQILSTTDSGLWEDARSDSEHHDEEGALDGAHTLPTAEMKSLKSWAGVIHDELSRPNYVIAEPGAMGNEGGIRINSAFHHAACIMTELNAPLPSKCGNIPIVCGRNPTFGDFKHGLEATKRFAVCWNIPKPTFKVPKTPSDPAFSEKGNMSSWKGGGQPVVIPGSFSFPPSSRKIRARRETGHFSKRSGKKSFKRDDVKVNKHILQTWEGPEDTDKIKNWDDIKNRNCWRMEFDPEIYMYIAIARKDPPESGYQPLDNSWAGDSGEATTTAAVDPLPGGRGEIAG